MRAPQLHPEDRDSDPELKAEMLRDSGGERVYVEWVSGAVCTSLHLLTEEGGKEDRLLTLDTIELPQAVRALRAVVKENADTAPIRNMGAFERVWLEGESGYVTLMKEEVQEPAGMLVLEEKEARHLLETVEGVIEDVGGVEDDPYV